MSKFSELFSHSGHHCACEEHEHAGENNHGSRVSPHSFDMVLLIRLAATAALFFVGIFSKIGLIFYILSAIIAGYDVIISALSGLIRRHVFDECLLMTIAVIAAFIIREYAEGTAVMLLFQLGEFFQSYAVGRTRESVEQLMDMRPESAVVLKNGEEKVVPAEEIQVGDIIVIRPGEKIAADCIVIEGESVIDCSALTGESVPVNVSADDAILSGSINVSSVLRAEVTAPVNESTASRILELVRAESEKKGKTEKFITKFAKYYTPAVIAAAVLIAVLLPILTELTFSESVYRALVFLVISCPCAIVISVPLAYFAGIGGASRQGVLFRSSAAMDAAAEAKAVVFDKTGTLTTGSFRVSSVKSDRMDDQMFLKIAAHTEAYSNHPLARSVREAYGGNIYIELIESFEEIPGKGVHVTIDGVPILFGSDKLLAENGIDAEVPENGELALYMAIGNQYAGRMILSDCIKDDASRAVTALRDAGCSRISMLTGDSDPIASRIAESVGISDFTAGCLPEDKVARVKEIKSGIGSGTLIFVGDGLNDAPVLTAADVGAAMGGLGSDAAVEAADIVIMDDRPIKIASAIAAARSTRKIVRQNIIMALAVKLVIMIIGAVGISTLWFAVIADVGVALAAVLNSLRAFAAAKSKN